MSATLVISTEEGVALHLTVGSLPVTLGRSEGNVVRGADRRLSRRHALVRRLNSGLYEVEDLESSNGTTLNGQPLAAGQSAVLQAGDRFSCGGLMVEFQTEAQETRSAYEIIDELRADNGKLIDEAAGLRQAVQEARDARTQAERTRDEEHDEATRLREAVVTGQQHMAALEARIASLGTDLRNERTTKATTPAAAVVVASDASSAELARERRRVSELEEHQGQLALRNQELKKEAERLQERVKKLEAREADLTNAIKPSLLRVAELTREVERLRQELAKR